MPKMSRDAPEPAMLDDHEYIELSKGYGDREEKITGNDPPGVQAKKG
jgi:hypothetical protein